MRLWIVCDAWRGFWEEGCHRECQGNVASFGSAWRSAFYRHQTTPIISWCYFRVLQVSNSLWLLPSYPCQHKPFSHFSQNNPVVGPFSGHCRAPLSAAFKSKINCWTFVQRHNWTVHGIFPYKTCNRNWGCLCMVHVVYCHVMTEKWGCGGGEA